MFEKYTLFENKGEIDIDSFVYMGCSTKDGKSTIGKFGTGLKYALAVLIRNGVKIEIFSGKEQVMFTTQKKTIGGKEFDQILMNGKETGITTNLGVEWELWQAVREFYANCIDEDGEKKNWKWKRQGKVNHTRIFLSHREIRHTFQNFRFNGWKKITDETYHRKKDERSPIKVFKEGFLVYQGEQYETSLYDYRIDTIGINEARLVENTYEMKLYIGGIIANMDFADVNHVIESHEYNHGYGYQKLGEGWTEAQASRGGEIDVNNTDLKAALKQLRAVSDKKYRYNASGGYYGSNSSIIIVEEYGTREISEIEYKVYFSTMESEGQKFDYDMNKQEIHINIKNKKESKHILKIVEELIKNASKDRATFIVELLEKIYKK